MCQPLDFFVNAMIKDASRAKREAEKLRRILAGEWADDLGGSGKLSNPGKRFFLTLAATSLEKVNSMTYWIGEAGLSDRFVRHQDASCNYSELG